MLKLQNKISSYLLSISISILLFGGSFLISQKLIKPPINITMQNRALNINKDILNIFHLGQKRMISSLLWIQTLLDSDIDHYKKKDSNSWMYLRFETISSIDPMFFQLYYFGGQYLSVIKDDDIGAKKLYDRGVHFFPDNFWLNFHGGFHYYFELGDAMGSLKFFNKIKDHPLSKSKYPYLPSLISRITASAGNLQDAYELLLISYNSLSEENPLRSSYHHSLYAIKSEIDLNCLNSHKKSCERKDFDGDHYKKINNKFKAKKEWSPFRPHSKE